MAEFDPKPNRLSRRETSALCELLIRAVALSDRTDPAGELSALASAAPLDVLTDAAWIHRLSGTLERTLRSVPEVPASVLNQLRRDAEHEALRGLVQHAALRDIGAGFDDRGVSWLVMKGPVVAHFLYTHPSDRRYADLDLLVDRRDFQAAVEVLEDLGYEHVIKNWRLAEEMRAGEIQLARGTASVDLHWHLHYSAADRRRVALAPDDMLSRVRRVQIAGQLVPTFDAVDTLLNLAYHAARSDGHRLIWLKDIERSLVVDEPDMAELVRRALHAQCGPQVGVMLLRARELLGAPISEEVIAALLPTPLRVIDRSSRRISAAVQLHERTTLTRFVTRSIGRSTRSTIAQLPIRAAYRTASRLAPPKPNETSDPLEKQRFFDALAASGR